MSQQIKIKEQMSGRERIMAAIQGKPIDRIPFVPLVDVYTVLDMPRPFVEAYEAAAARGYWQGMLAVIRMLGCDIMLRHVRVVPVSPVAPHLCGLGHFKPPVVASSRLDGSTLVETLETPVGTLTATWGFTDRHGWIPYPIKHLVASDEDLKIFHFAVDHLSAEPPAASYGNFLEAEKTLGDDGVPTASLLNTPLMHLIEVLWGLDHTYYFLQDYPAEVEDILEKLHQSQLLIVQRIAESPAKVVIEYENTSSTLLSPKVFRRYCLPYLNQHAKILKSAGKTFLVHMCGKLNAFVDDLAGADFDGVCDIAPLPTGNLTLDDAAARLNGKTVIGGIDATTFIVPDPDAVEAEVGGLVERVKPYSGVLLGSADTAPRGTPVENFRLIQRLVNTVGSYVEPDS